MARKRNNRQFFVAKGFENQDINLPKRQTEHAAGYDFEASEDTTIYPVWWNFLSTLVVRPRVNIMEFEADGKKLNFNSIEGIDVFPIQEEQEEHKGWQKLMRPTLVPTGVKADMGDDEALFLYNRSSNPLKKLLMLGNGVGVIDKDYFENESNDGHIMFQFVNLGLFPVTLKKGERIGQGVFSTFLKTRDDEASGKRTGGHGSTDEEAKA